MERTIEVVHTITRKGTRHTVSVSRFRPGRPYPEGRTTVYTGGSEAKARVELYKAAYVVEVSTGRTPRWELAGGGAANKATGDMAVFECVRVD